MLIPLILTWEYPPRVVGDMAHYVENLASELNKIKKRVKVVTCHDSAFSYEKRNGYLEVYWASNPVEPHISVLTWCLTLNSEMERIVSDIVYENKATDYVLVVQDWHFVPAGVSLSRAHRLPFVFTLHSLEEQRSPGSNYALNSCIKGLETMGLRESNLVLVKNDSMERAVIESYGVPEQKVAVVPANSQNLGKRMAAAYRAASASLGE